MEKELINDPRWVCRMEHYFETMDKDHNGFLTMCELQGWATTLEALCNPTATEMVALRANLVEFWGQIGLKQDTFMRKEDFIRGANQLGIIDLQRAQNGEKTYLQRLYDAYFEVTDYDKCGSLCFEKLKFFMTGVGLDPHGAGKWLKEAEKNIDGTIDKYQFFVSECKFWYNRPGI